MDVVGWSRTHARARHFLGARQSGIGRRTCLSDFWVRRLSDPPVIVMGASSAWSRGLLLPPRTIRDLRREDTPAPAATRHTVLPLTAGPSTRGTTVSETGGAAPDKMPPRPLAPAGCCSPRSSPTPVWLVRR